MTELVESKLCRKCKTLKSLLDFGIDRKSKDGHKTRCRQCVAGENRLYKLNNRNVVNAAKNRYRQRHTAEMADYMRLYRARVRGSQLADRHRQHLEFHKEVNIQLQFRLGAIMASAAKNRYRQRHTAEMADYMPFVSCQGPWKPAG